MKMAHITRFTAQRRSEENGQRTQNFKLPSFGLLPASSFVD